MIKQPAASPGEPNRFGRASWSRRRFFKGVGGVGAAGSLATILAGCPGDRPGEAKPGQGGGKSSSPTDLTIANYALMLEYLEVAFYQQALESGQVKGQALDIIKEIADHENQHVATLEAAVKKGGGKPVAKPKLKLPPLASQAQILTLASTFENLGAAAYLGQGARIQSPDLLATALSIHSVEARHASVINIMIGKDPVVDGSAFAKPATMAETLKAVKPFIAA